MLKRARYHQDLQAAVCGTLTDALLSLIWSQAVMSYLPGQFTHIPAVSSSSNITGGVNVSDCVLNYNTLSGNKTVLSAISFFIIVPVY